jgi:GT2 family glycosyltransferase
LGIFDLGLEARPLTDAPFGANMAFRRRVFEKHGGFRTDLGPGPNNKVRNNEDTEFGRRLLTAGERLKYAPSALVYHPVQQNGLQRDYFLAWWFNKGRADIQENGIATDTKWFICGVPLYLLRKLAIGTLRWMLTLERSRRFTQQLSVWFFAGRVLESYHQSKEVRHKGKKLASV